MSIGMLIFRLMPFNWLANIYLKTRRSEIGRSRNFGVAVKSMPRDDNWCVISDGGVVAEIFCVEDDGIINQSKTQPDSYRCRVFEYTSDVFVLYGEQVTEDEYRKHQLIMKLAGLK